MNIGPEDFEVKNEERGKYKALTYLIITDLFAERVNFYNITATFQRISFISVLI